LWTCAPIKDFLTSIKCKDFHEFVRKKWGGGRSVDPETGICWFLIYVSFTNEQKTVEGLKNALGLIDNNDQTILLEFIKQFVNVPLTEITSIQILKAVESVSGKTRRRVVIHLFELVENIVYIGHKVTQKSEP